MNAFNRTLSLTMALAVTGFGSFFADARKNLRRHFQPEPTTAAAVEEEAPPEDPYVRPEGIHETSDGRGKLVALTFDDGPSSISSHILDTLTEADGHATFFCLGDRAESYREALRHIAAQGSEIASHSYNHKRLTRLGARELEEDLSKAAGLLEEFSGKPPVLLRPPYGSISDYMLERTEMPVILWSIDSEDWHFCEELCRNRSEEQRQRDFVRVVNSVLDYVQDGDIVLMHDLYCFTQDVADAVIAELRHKGWKLVTVSELFAAKGIELQPGVAYHCAR